MEESLIKVFTDILNSSDGMAATVIENVIKSPNEFNSSVYGAVQAIGDNAVLPVAYLCLSLFALIEMVAFTSKQNSGGEVLVQDIAKLFLKVVIAQLIMQNTFTVLGAVFELVTYITAGAQGYINTSGSLGIGDKATLLAQISDMSMFEQMSMYPLSWLVNMISLGLEIACWLLVFGRMIQIYIYTSFAPIPFSTFLNAEASGIGKNFLKSYAAVVLQGFFIVIVVFIYQMAIRDVFIDGELMDVCFGIIQWSVLLAYALWQTGSWSKSIMAAS